MKRDKSISKKSHKDVKKLIPEEPEVPDLFNSDRKTVKSLCAADGINPNPEGYLKF